MFANAPDDAGTCLQNLWDERNPEVMEVLLELPAVVERLVCDAKEGDDLCVRPSLAEALFHLAAEKELYCVNVRNPSV